MHQRAEQIAKEYKQSLIALYGSEIAELIVFGSYARGEQHAESDLDFAVVFRDRFEKGVVREKVSSIASCLSLKYGLMVSTILVDLHKKEHSVQGVFRDIRKEGIAIELIIADTIA